MVFDAKLAKKKKKVLQLSLVSPTGLLFAVCTQKSEQLLFAPLHSALDCFPLYVL